MVPASAYNKSPFLAEASITHISKFLSDNRVLVGVNTLLPREKRRSTAADDGNVVLKSTNASLSIGAISWMSFEPDLIAFHTS